MQKHRLHDVQAGQAVTVKSAFAEPGELDAYVQQQQDATVKDTVPVWCLDLVTTVDTYCRGSIAECVQVHNQSISITHAIW